ncbi:hypothetical protein Poly30_19840 [Planctomycetes bacterium Poly30]|uniref:Periplasmic folding chaperone n=1 Tax=Saltatorellus ferox TaxID=2528018 RepID=A0A518EQV5_9BACT|nr:hypothetical protein Poly30_19840 [Planctomycetes bacterium Poly30]
MSDKTEKVTPEVLDEHGDELIHVPTGQSRLRYIATIGLVLFLLIIFVVADLFQSSLTGGGGGSDEIFLTWQDPADGEKHEVKESEFFETARFLSNMAAFGIYTPYSLIFGEQTQKRSSRPEPTEQDVASFLIYEEMAKDAGIAVSDQEHIDFLRSRFGSNEGLEAAARQARTTRLAISEDARRIERVAKLNGLMFSTLGIPDPDAVVKTWQEGRPEFKFQSISVNRDDFLATAEAEVPDDEALATWFHERPDFEQRKLYTEEKVVPRVAYVVPGDDFDPAKLFEAYPAPEGVDLDQQAQSYFSQFRTTRFKAPEKAKPEGDEEVAEPDEIPEKPFYDFEEVEEEVRAEAPIHAALTAFVTDMQDRSAEGATVDLAAEAEALGLTVVEGGEPMTREEMTAADTWGSAQIASQLAFSSANAIVPRVTATPDALVVAQVASKIERAEPPFEDIRDQVATLWAEQRAAELAVESLDYLRQTLAAKPDDVENADWTPEIAWIDLQKAAGEAGYATYDRPWLERSAMPEGQTFQTATPVNRYMMMTPTVYDMEPGTVGPAAKGSDGKTAFLIRFDSQREKDVSEIDANTVFQLRGQAANEQLREFGAQVLLGDGAWLAERAAIRFPKNEAREAEKKAKEANPTAG